MIRTITTIMIVIIINIIVVPVYAAESSPSADIRIKLEELKKDIASKATKLKEAISQKLINKAYVGTVENKQSFSANKTADSLTLVTKTGAKIVTINQDTIFESKVKKQTRSNKTLILKDYVAALGDIDDTGVLTAKKVILLPPINLPPKTFFWGQVASRSGSLLTIKDKDLKNITFSFSKAEIPTNLKLNKSVIVTAYQTQGEIFEASFIFVIP